MAQLRRDVQTFASLPANSRVVSHIRAPKGLRRVMMRVAHCLFAVKLIAEVVEDAMDPIMHLVALDSGPRNIRFCLFLSPRSSVSV